MYILSSIVWLKSVLFNLFVCFWFIFNFLNFRLFLRHLLQGTVLQSTTTGNNSSHLLTTSVHEEHVDRDNSFWSVVAFLCYPRARFIEMKAKGKKLKRWPKHGSSSSNPSERRFREAAKNKGFKRSGLFLRCYFYSEVHCSGPRCRDAYKTTVLTKLQCSLSVQYVGILQETFYTPFVCLISVLTWFFFFNLFIFGCG